MIKTGGKLGHFVVQQKLGDGGMGAIFAAVDSKLHRKVALKIIKKKYLEIPEFYSSFKKEASTQAQLNHPNIVTLYSLEKIAGELVMVLEYVEGLSLRQILKTCQCFAVLPAIHIIKQVLRGLKYAHGANIVHRDIKPGNILITSRNVVKISDFGIALIRGLEASETGSLVMGTPHYASPEQIAGFPLDGRTDLYSTGITFYELLTGQVPFQFDSGRGIDIRNFFKEERTFVPPSALNADVDQDLDLFFKRALKFESEMRFQSALEMLHELDDLEKRYSGKKEKKEAP